MKMLRDLLAIKRFREDKAQALMRQQRQALRLAQEARAGAETRLEQLLADDLRIERDLYQDLCARLVQLRDIEEVQQTVASLRARERQQQQALEDALREQQAAQQQFDHAHQMHREAARQTSKFVDLARSFEVLDALATERSEDLEMEEAASVAREIDDWQPGSEDSMRFLPLAPSTLEAVHAQ